jgi:hypothetical protein
MILKRHITHEYRGAVPKRTSIFERHVIGERSAKASDKPSPDWRAMRDRIEKTKDERETDNWDFGDKGGRSTWQRSLV